jgi:transposase-like protein
LGTSKYTAEFRADAVALYRASPGRTYAAVAKDLGVNHETLRVWVREAEQASVPRAAEICAACNATSSTSSSYEGGRAADTTPSSTPATQRSRRDVSH